MNIESSPTVDEASLDSPMIHHIRRQALRTSGRLGRTEIHSAGPARTVIAGIRRLSPLVMGLAEIGRFRGPADRIDWE